jgi:hypothetical protein
MTKHLHLSFLVTVDIDTDESQVLDALLEGIPSVLDNLESVGIDCPDPKGSEATAIVEELTISQWASLGPSENNIH